MHVVTLLKTEMFEVRQAGQLSSIANVFPRWNELDRFGLVIDEPFGGIGASHLLQSAMMAFYDVKPQRRASASVYPEIYAFHIGKGYGAHAPYDFWPARREVILETTDPKIVLDAINDRGITRLAVPDRPKRIVEHRPKEVEAALDRITSAFVYSASGRVPDPNLQIAGTDRRTEYNAYAILKPMDKSKELKGVSSGGRPLKEAEDSYFQWLSIRDEDVTDADRARVKAQRQAIATGGLVTESYKSVSPAEALQRLASAGLLK